MESVVTEIRLPGQQQLWIDELTQNSICLPLILIPTKPQITLTETLQYIERFHQSIIDKLLKCGAILFRRFPIHTAEDFNQFALGFKWKELPYIGELDDVNDFKGQRRYN